MTDKQRYIEFCENERSIPIYSRPWWLDCVCGEKNWDVLLSLQDNAVVAAMPYYMPCSGIIAMPPFTQTMGIWFNPAFLETNASKEIYREHTICENIINQLPDTSFFQIRFHHSFNDWLPFYWRGFRQTTRYNYLYSDIENFEELKKNLGRSINESLKKAAKSKLYVRQNIDIEDFLTINSQVFERQNKKPISPKTLIKLINTSIARNQGNIWGSFDENDILNAAVFVVWQDKIAYAIANGTNTKLRQSGGLAMAILQAVSDLSSLCTVFDFGGSMIKGVEHFFREFGTEQKTYFQIEKGKLNFYNKLKLKLSVSNS